MSTLPEKSVVLIGAGGLGSAAALAMLDAVPEVLRRLVVIDDDTVDLSNLHRQLLHGEADVGRAKVDSAADLLRRRAPGLDVVPARARLMPDNARDLLAGAGVVIEGSDSIETKFLASDTAVTLGVPIVIGGVVRWSGQVLTVLPGRSACYRCLFEEPPPPGAAPTCQEAGVLGPACGVIGALQAAEALRILCGQPPRYAGAVLMADLLAGRCRTVPVARRPGCLTCGADQEHIK